MKISEMLTNARGRINNGWCKGAYSDGEGNYCAMGALSTAAQGSGALLLADEYKQAYLELNRQLVEFGFDHDGMDIVDFNDRDSTTKQDVLNLFDKAINCVLEKGL